MTSHRMEVPVRTVQQLHDDNGVDEDYRDDEICNVSTMSRSPSPPIETVIHSFNEELDHFSRSFDEMASSIKADRKSVTTPSGYYRQPIYHFTAASSGKKRTPSLGRVRDPPPSVNRHTPVRNHGDQSTPVRGQHSRPSSASRSRSPTPSFSAERPPAPVETPGYFASPPETTPLATPNPRRTAASARRDQFHQSTPASKQRRDPSLSADRRKPPPSPSPVVDLELHLAPNGWEDALNKMRQTLQDQETRILQLEHENRDLRAQLQQERDQSHFHLGEEELKTNMDRLYVSDGYSSHNGRSPWRRGGDPENDSRVDPRNSGGGGESASVARHRREMEPNGRPPVPTPSKYHTAPLSTPSIRSIRSPPSRIIRTANSHQQMIPEGEGFTPGTRFVAELSKLMKMGNEHHVPLSFIIDRHWDQLKETFREEDMLSVVK